MVEVMSLFCIERAEQVHRAKTAVRFALLVVMKVRGEEWVEVRGVKLEHDSHTCRNFLEPLEVF